MFRKTLSLVLLCSVTFTVHAQVEFERPPINYLDAEVNDPIAKLSAKIASGEVQLQYEPGFGYLKSVLSALDIPVSSQTLVFSRTSLQLQRISPRTPRSLYFNDQVYVGFCQRGDVLEFAATDATQGATFYTLEQKEVDQPRFVRDRGSCLTCHASSRTQHVPGYLVRSVFADASGRPKFGSGTFNTTHRSKFEERWGGWYVSGTHGEMRHMGNVICKGDESTFDREAGANDIDLTDNFKTATYLTPHSDIVALMVLEHQGQMHNAIAAANYETRAALHQSDTMNKLLDRPEGFVSDSAERRIVRSADRVLEYLLFCDEYQLTDRVEGSTSFAKEFEQRGIRDSQGRSLRDFDLTRRLFKYPCSYQIYSDAFAALPIEVRSIVLRKLTAILQGESANGFEHLTPETRHAILEILRDTLPEMKHVSLASNQSR